MGFDGSGNYSRVHDWTDDRDNAIKIRADRMDEEFDDIAASLNSVFLRTGIVPMSGDLQMGGNDIKGIASGSAAAPSIQFSADPNSGIFLDGAGKVAITANGTERFEVNTTGAALVGALSTTGDITSSGAMTATGAITGASFNVNANTFFGKPSASIVKLGLDSNDYFLYDQAADQLDLYIGGASQFAVAAGIASVGGQTIWHAGNDGSGSGLDADLLDGVHAAAFPQLSAANSFTNTENLFGTSIGVRADGGPYYAWFNAAGSTRWGYFQHTGTTLYLLNEVSGQAIALATTGGGGFTFNGSTVWHAGNDGAGSGLDADTVDGVQLSALAQLSGAAFTGNITTTGNIQVTGTGGFNIGTVGGAPRIDFSASTFNMLTSGGAGAALSIGALTASTGTFSGAVTIGGSTVWHAGNDGASSGLDADLLDGAQGALYLKGSRTSQLVTDGTAAPSGGSDGDIYFQYT